MKKYLILVLNIKEWNIKYWIKERRCLFSAADGFGFLQLIPISLFVELLVFPHN